MEAILRFLQHADMDSFASDPRVLFVVGALIVLAIIFRWKAILLLAFGIGGTMAVIRYSRITESSGPAFDKGLIVFVAGCILVGVVLIYFLFIRGD